MLNKTWFGCILILLLFVSSCKKKEIEVIDATAEEIVSFRQPFGFPSTVYPINERPVETEKFKLGRELFYSTELSSNNTVSCASCHAQTHAFADHNIALSSGVNGVLGIRNSPAIFNLAWQPTFMWDGGVTHLEMLSLAPITNPLEMNETMPNLMQRLNQSTYWKKRFKEVYGGNEITDQQLFISLTQFMLLIISDNSLYDKMIRGEATFNTEQQAGYALFQQNCASCHAEPMMTDYSYRNNGLDLNSMDEGRFGITQLESDRGKFKVPTLRNVLLTYPYMHDGRFFTIDQVLNHYTDGIQAHANLDGSLINGISLTTEEKKQLKRFLETLNDYELMDSKLLREP